MPLTVGNVLGAYEILAPLGEGGMGQVFKARDPRLGRDVAIKVLPAHLANDPLARERLRREAVAAAALDHPFICKVFEIGEEPLPAPAGRTVLFIVMEFVRGETLHSRLSAGPVPIGEALVMTQEIVEALEAAHARQIVHRDLKPANVMISAQGHVKVMDFGLAKDLSIDEERQTRTVSAVGGPLTGQGQRVGTPAYMSPEQVVGDALDARSDIFSLGVLLCELVSGVHPFQRPTMAGTVSALLQEAPVIAPPASVGDLPSAVRQLLHRMLAKSPGDRYQSMSDVRRDLASLTSTGGAPAVIAAASADRIGQTRRWPMVGRDAERGELMHRLDEALAGRGSLSMIGGEPGIGKTRLTEAVQDEARRRGCMCLVGHAYEMEGAPPYVPFIEMLEYSLRVVPGAAFRHALGDGAPEIAKLLPDLRRAFPDIPQAIDVPPEQQRWRLFNAYRDFVVRSCAMSPIVVVLEDLHWADEPTLQLLLHIAPAFAQLPLLVLGTYRDVELDVTRPFAKVLETLIRQRHATRIALRRLSASGVDQLLTVMSGRPAPPSLARVIFAETEGNPFFVEEVFQHLREEGRVFDERGEWRKDLRVETLDVPEGVRLVIGRRLERLSETTRRVLTTAAVVGRSFSLPLLEALDEGSGDAVLDAMEDAERAHLIAPQRVGRETRYLFAHELIRQTLADALSMPRRQRLHTKIAAAIERTYASALDKHVSALAHHLYQAGAGADPEKTTLYLVRAADEARAAAAHEDALRLVDQAISIWEDETGDRMADLLERRGLALRSVGRPDEAIRALTRASGMWDAERSADRLARSAYELAATLGWQARPKEAAARVGDALARLAAASPEVRMPLEMTRPSWLAAAGDLNALDEFERTRARLGDDPRVQAMAYVMEPHLRWFLAELPQCAELARAGADRLNADGHPWFAAETEWMANTAPLFLADFAAAEHRLAEADERATRIGHHGARVVFRQVHGVLAAARGDFDASERWFLESAEVARAANSPWGYFADLTRSVQLIHRDRIAEGMSVLREVVATEPDTYWSFVSRAHWFRVLASIAPADAEEYAARHRFAVPNLGTRNPLGRWSQLTTVIEGLALLGRRPEAAALAPHAEEALRLGLRSMNVFSASNRTCAGIAASCGENWSAACAHFEAAIGEAETLPLLPAQPSARTWYAELLLRRDAPGDADRARVLLDEAIALCDRHGLVLMGDRARRMRTGGPPP
jgi:tetratricopeptide (TPR) repeat protein